MISTFIFVLFRYKMGLQIKSVLVVDGVGANCTEILNSHGISVINKAKITKEELLQEVPVRALLHDYVFIHLYLHS